METGSWGLIWYLQVSSCSAFEEWGHTLGAVRHWSRLLPSCVPPKPSLHQDKIGFVCAQPTCTSPWHAFISWKDCDNSPASVLLSLPTLKCCVMLSHHWASLKLSFSVPKEWNHINLLFRGDTKVNYYLQSVYRFTGGKCFFPVTSLATECPSFLIPFKQKSRLICFFFSVVPRLQGDRHLCHDKIN